jgi:hypothetical protein
MVVQPEVGRRRQTGSERELAWKTNAENPMGPRGLRSRRSAVLKPSVTHRFFDEAYFGSASGRPTMFTERHGLIGEVSLSKEQKSWRLLSSVALLCILASCGGTWVDDGGNFDRVLGFGGPPEVKVLHGFTGKSPTGALSIAISFALQASPKFMAGLTSSDRCGVERPKWSLPKPLRDYDAWVSKEYAGYRVFRDRADGALFLCDQRL